MSNFELLSAAILQDDIEEGLDVYIAGTYLPFLLDFFSERETNVVVKVEVVEMFERFQNGRKRGLQLMFLNAIFLEDSMFAYVFP